MYHQRVPPSLYVCYSNLDCLRSILNLKLSYAQPKYGPILVPTGPSNPPIQPSILDPPLSRADIATSENLQNAPDWQIIYIGASSFHQCALFFFSPECTTALLKYYFVAQIFLLGVGRVRSAKKIDGQPEDCTLYPSMLYHYESTNFVFISILFPRGRWCVIIQDLGDLRASSPCSRRRSE